MLVYSVGAIIFSQLMSLVGQTPAGGFAMVTIIHIITGTYKHVYTNKYILK